MRIEKIAEMQAVLDDPASPYDIVPADAAEQHYGIVFAPGQKYNIAMSKTMVIVDRRTKQIAGFVYKKTFCMARWCSQWDSHCKEHPVVVN